MNVILAFCCDILLKNISRGLNEGLIGICHLRVENVKLCEQMRKKQQRCTKIYIVKSHSLFNSDPSVLCIIIVEKGCLRFPTVFILLQQLYNVDMIYKNNFETINFYL